jgi:dTMP kinase
MEGNPFVPAGGSSNTAIQVQDSLKLGPSTGDCFYGTGKLTLRHPQQLEAAVFVTYKAMRVYVWPPSSCLRGSLEQATTHDDLIAHWESVSDKATDDYEICILHAATASPTVGMILIYALYRKQIPVLVLGPAEALSSFQDLRHDLLTVTKCDDESKLQGICEEFLRFPETPGRIFTFEGGDGAGKQTQTRMLVERLSAEGYPVATLDFPHDHAMYGALIREILSGKFGKISEVNPLLFASIYAFNRLDTLPRLRYWVMRGKNVILDRYSSANWGHQASKYDSDDERLNIINTLRRFEHEWLGLPESFNVFYLDLPPDFALKAMQSDSTRAALDIHETAGLQYKNRVRDTFLWCCDRFPEWTAMPCTQSTTEGEARISRDDLHNTIYAQVQPRLVNNVNNNKTSA